MSRFSKVAQLGMLAAALAVVPAFSQTSGGDRGRGTPAGSAIDQPSSSGSSSSVPGANGGAASPNTSTSAAPGAAGNGTTMMPNPAQDQNYNQTGNHNFGWLGLIGLAGLAGLMRRDRRTDTAATTRDDRINTR